jgi:hypothetical protein
MKSLIVFGEPDHVKYQTDMLVMHDSVLEIGVQDLAAKRLYELATEATNTIVVKDVPADFDFEKVFGMMDSAIMVNPHTPNYNFSAIYPRFIFQVNTMTPSTAWLYVPLIIRFDFVDTSLLDDNPPF